MCVFYLYIELDFYQIYILNYIIHIGIIYRKWGTCMFFNSWGACPICPLYPWVQYLQRVFIFLCSQVWQNTRGLWFWISQWENNSRVCDNEILCVLRTCGCRTSTSPRTSRLQPCAFTRMVSRSLSDCRGWHPSLSCYYSNWIHIFKALDKLSIIVLYFWQNLYSSFYF